MSGSLINFPDRRHLTGKRGPNKNLPKDLLLCPRCGLRKRESNGTGVARRALCPTCSGKQLRKNVTRHRHRAFKKDRCEDCGFIPQHPCQLDVDHVDANKANNEPSNLRTLCANCHRLKTQLNKDWANKTKRAS